MTNQPQKSVSQILSELKATSSRNAKIEILEEHKDHEALKTIIKAAIDPYSVFFITKIPDESHIPESFKLEELQSAGLDADTLILGMLQQIEQDSSRENIRAYFAIAGKILENDPDGLDLVRKILAGDLDCGIAKGIVNAVWPNHINTFDVMKASEKASLNKMRYPAYASTKIDGVRAVAFVRDGNVEVRSSSGRVFEKIPSIHQAILEFEQRVKRKMFDGFILDGEIVAVDDDGRQFPRAISNGYASKARSGSITDEDEKRLRFVAFDVLSSSTQLERGLDGRPLERRIENFIHIDHNSALRAVPSVIVENEKEAMAIFKMRVKEGEEGIVLKPLDSIYEVKRSTEWVKLKKEYDADVEIVDWKPHSKKDGMLGGLTVKSKDGKVIGDLGTKLTDKQRKDMYEMAVTGELVGRIITIVFHELTSSRGREELKFYLPRFIEFREDKDEADTIDKIQSMM